MKTKDGVVLSEFEIRKLYPQISFSTATYEELGWIEYIPPPPTPEEVAQREAYEAVVAADQAAHVAAKANPVIQYLRDHTPAEVEAYIDSNVTDPASTKAMLKHFGVALCVMSKRNFR